VLGWLLPPPPPHRLSRRGAACAYPTESKTGRIRSGWSLKSPLKGRGIAFGFCRPIAKGCEQDSEDDSRFGSGVRWAN
jgi:hypothetical protein